jgi:CarD family transcriptional regulator
MESEEFNKGDRVVYPSYGVGIITDISFKEIQGIRRKYYIITLINSDMKVMLSSDSILKSGIRHVVDADIINRVLDILRTDKGNMEADWKARYQNNMDKMKRGDIMEMAEMIKNLYLRNIERELSSLERKLYENVYKTVVNEIMLAKNISHKEAENLVADALTRDGER